MKAKVENGQLIIDNIHLEIIYGLLVKESHESLLHELVKRWNAYETISKVLTIWKDGAWKLWNKGDAHYAANDPDWLVNIDLETIDNLHENLELLEKKE